MNEANANIRKQELQEQKAQMLKQQEEEQRCLGGALYGMLGKMQRNETAGDITATGIELGAIRTQMMAANIVGNKSVRSLSLTHKKIEDEEGVKFAKMLLVNSYVRKVEFEGNKLGPKTALELANVLSINESLQFLDLSQNCLTSAYGDNPQGVLALAQALKQNTTLLSLGVAGNQLD